MVFEPQSYHVRRRLVCEGKRSTKTLPLLLGLSPWRVKADTRVPVSKDDRQKRSTSFYKEFSTFSSFPPLTSQSSLQISEADYALESLWSTNSPHSTHRRADTHNVTVVFHMPCTSKCQDNDRNWVPCVSFASQSQGLPTSILSIQHSLSLAHLQTPVPLPNTFSSARATFNFNVVIFRGNQTAAVEKPHHLL